VNVIKKRQLLEGLSYNISTAQELTEDQIDALLHVRDTMRRAGLTARADEHGRIIVRNQNQNQFPVAVALVI
jgi:ADP-heptose:LPS heptosyltransferase